MNEHLIAVVVVALVPLWGVWSWRRFQRALDQRREEARLAAYAETIVIEWGLAVALLAIWSSTGGSMADLGLTAPVNFAFGAVFVASLVVSGFLLSQLWTIRRLGEEARASLRKQMASFESILPHSRGERAVFLSLAVTAGFCEELLYRGFLITYLGSHIGLIGALIFSSLIFGLLHLYQGPVGALKAAFIGLVMGVVFLLSGSIWPAIILHVALDVQGGLTGYEFLGRSSAMAADARA